MASGNVRSQSCSSDLNLCPVVKVRTPDDLGSLSSAFEKELGNQRVVFSAIGCIECFRLQFCKERAERLAASNVVESITV
jgi:hypothetical protein